MQYANTIPAIGLVTENLGGDTSSWTLTNILGELLHKAEEKFGKRDMSWTIIGVEFKDHVPHVWLPAVGNQVSVRLSLKAASSLNVAFSELAHEVVHLLSPKPGRNALILEEGMAQWFSHQQCAHFNKPVGNESPNYTEARELVDRLLTHNPTIIRDARIICPKIDDIRPDLLLKIDPQVDPELVDRLCHPFYVLT